jgi:hypothetical protein
MGDLTKDKAIVALTDTLCKVLVCSEVFNSNIYDLVLTARRQTKENWVSLSLAQNLVDAVNAELINPS